MPCHQKLKSGDIDTTFVIFRVNDDKGGVSENDTDVSTSSPFTDVQLSLSMVRSSWSGGGGAGAVLVRSGSSKPLGANLRQGVSTPKNTYYRISDRLLSGKTQGIARSKWPSA